MRPGPLPERLKSPHLLSILILLLLVLLFFWRVLLGSGVLLPTDALFVSPPWKAFAPEFGITTPHNELIADMILQNYSWKSFAKESYQRGHIPLWNPYIFTGMPFLAEGQYAALYPLGILFYLLPVAQAYGWFTALHLFLGGLFAYIYLRVIGASTLGSLISAIAFAFSGFLIASFLWPQVVSTAIWMPLLLALVELSIECYEEPTTAPTKSPLPWVLLGGAVVGLQFLAGHMEISFYLLFSALFYAALRLFILLRQSHAWSRVLRASLALSAMMALGFGLAAAQLLPFYELIQENYRAGSSSYQEVVSYAFPPKQLFTFLMPDFFGNPTHHSYFDLWEGRAKPVESQDPSGNQRSYPFWGVKNYVEGASYLGVLPLLLAAVALGSQRNRYVLIFGLYALFSLLLAFGSPLYALFFYGIPGFEQLHTPFRWVLPYSLSIAVLAGLGATHLREAPPRFAQGIGLWTTLGGASLLLLLALSQTLPQTSQAVAANLLSLSSSLSLAFPSSQMLYSYQFRNLLLLGLLLLAGGLLIRWAIRKSKLLYLAPALLALDLFLFGYDFNSVTDPRLLDFTPPSIKFLKGDPDLYRIVSFNYDDTLRPNSGMLFRLQDIRGYDTVIPRRYVEFWRLLEEPSGLLYSQINKLVEASSLNSRLLDLMNVKYVLTTQNITLPHYTEVYRGEINIYRNDDFLPRAFAVFQERRVASAKDALRALASGDFDPTRTVVLERAEELTPLSTPAREWVPARVTSYQPNRVEVEVAMPQTGYLILTDSYFPGWRAFEEDQELPLLRADYLFRAVMLPQGEHRVRFQYSPESFRLGLYVSFLSGLAFVLGLAFWGWQALYREREETSTLRRIAKNALTQMGAQVINRLMDLAFAIFMLRYLGPERVGKYAFAVVLIGYFSIFTDFGLGTLMTREVAKEPSQANRYLSNTILLRLWLLLLSVPFLLGALWLYVWRFGLSHDVAQAVTILLFALSLLPNSIALAFSALFNAHEKMEYPAAISILTNLLRVSLGLAALLIGWGIVGLALVSVLASTFSALLLALLALRTFFPPRMEPDPPFQREMVSTSLPLMVNNLLSTLFFRVDVMLLKPMKGDAINGWYTTAYRFIDGLNIIPAFFTLAIFPALSRYAETSHETLRRAYARALKALLIVAMPLTVGTTLIADRLILLFFAEEYRPSILALQILIWFLPFSYINSVTQYVLIALNQQRFLTVAFLIGFGFNVAANLLLIPHFSLLGAALVTILSEIVLLIPFYYAVHKHLGGIPLLGLAWRPTLAAMLMGALLLPLLHLNLVVIIGLGAVIYLVALLFLRTFDEEDLALIKALIRR